MQFKQKFLYIYLELFNFCYVFFMKVTVFVRGNTFSDRKILELTNSLSLLKAR